MSNPTFAQYVAAERAKGLADTTIRNRSSILRTLQTFCGRPAHELELSDLRAYLGRDTDAKPGTRKTERGVFVAYFTYLVEEGLRLDNPTERLAPVKAPKGTPRPFTKEQIDAMLNSGAYRKTRAMILLGYYQGFRVSQIARVHGRDIDLESNTISTVAKGSKDGVLPLHPVIRELAMTMPRDGYWFPARKNPNRPMKSTSVTNLITRAKHRAGIFDTKLTPHSLRHSFGTDLVESGVDIRVVQELMMHESLGSTQIYTGVSSRLKQEGILHLPRRPILEQSGRRAA